MILFLEILSLVLNIAIFIRIKNSFSTLKEGRIINGIIFLFRGDFTIANLYLFSDVTNSVYKSFSISGKWKFIIATAFGYVNMGLVWLFGFNRMVVVPLMVILVEHYCWMTEDDKKETFACMVFDNIALCIFHFYLGLKVLAVQDVLWVIYSFACFYKLDKPEIEELKKKWKNRRK